MGERDDEAYLLKVAQAVVDGNPVDWDAERRRLEEELARLKELEALAAAHREAMRASLEPADDATECPPSPAPKT